MTWHTEEWGMICINEKRQTFLRLVMHMHLFFSSAVYFGLNWILRLPLGEEVPFSRVEQPNVTRTPLSEERPEEWPLIADMSTRAISIVLSCRMSC